MQIARIRNLLTVGLLALVVNGCGDTSDLGKLKEGFTEKPDNYEDMMKAANNFAAKGDAPKAMLWYQNAMANAESEFGPNDGRVANAAMYDAAIARANNKLGEAEEMYKRAYNIQLKISGANSVGIKDVRRALCRNSCSQLQTR